MHSSHKHSKNKNSKNNLNMMNIIYHNQQNIILNNFKIISIKIRNFIVITINIII